MSQTDTAENEDSTGTIPPYKKRAEIQSLANQIASDEEIVAPAEKCGITAEGVRDILNELEASIEDVREHLEVPDDE